MENILWDDVVFKLRKTRQKLALSLTPLGAVRAAAEGTGYKNRRLGKSRGVRFDSRLVKSVRCDTLWAWNGRSVFLLALLLNVSGNTHAVSLLHASSWVQLLWRQRRILSPLSPSPLLRVSIKKKKKSLSPHDSLAVHPYPWPSERSPTLPSSSGLCVRQIENEQQSTVGEVSQPLKVMVLARRLAGPDNAVPSLPGSDSWLSKKRNKKKSEACSCTSWCSQATF